ncbi:MAG: Gfo/Idh/MocA family oxidoreductase [Halioglobus sp.]
MNILVQGTGLIAEEYCKICSDLGYATNVVGRSEESTKSFTERTGISAVAGGLANNLALADSCTHSIIAVSEDQLGTVLLDTAKAGISNILVEKPGAATIHQLNQLNVEIAKTNANVYIAYNRRYFSSVVELIERIKTDGGCTSFHFEFTEWSHVIKDLIKNPGVLENWGWHNSSHVIDLAFFVGGSPNRISSYVSGGLDWHPTGSVFTGSGIADNGAHFTYHSNWEGPGRWSLEFITRHNRYLLAPMEGIQVQKIGTIPREPIELDDELDNKWKPGFYLQTRDFLKANPGCLKTLTEQVDDLAHYEKIFRGT